MPFLFEDKSSPPSAPDVGAARAVFAPRRAVGGVVAAMEDRARGDGLRIVTIRFDRLPPLTSLIDEVLTRLADLALAIWPDWFDEPDREHAPDAWRKVAAKLCDQGRRPLPRGYTPSASARRLAKAIDPSPLLIALAVEDEAPHSGALLGLAKAAEWLSRVTEARVVVVLPDAHAEAPELDSVNFDAVHIRPPRSAESTEETDAESVSTTAARTKVSPLIGQPNPSSGGEKLLSARLARDVELAGLFQFNLPVETTRGSRFLVDLVWPDGKVVVEVDGYYFHKDEASFSRDRNRDYELTITGFLVLRLPEDEVVADVGLTVEKIRDMVAVRRKSPPVLNHNDKRA